MNLARGISLCALDLVAIRVPSLVLRAKTFDRECEHCHQRNPTRHSRQHRRFARRARRPGGSRRPGRAGTHRGVRWARARTGSVRVDAVSLSAVRAPAEARAELRRAEGTNRRWMRTGRCLWWPRSSPGRDCNTAPAQSDQAQSDPLSSASVSLAGALQRRAFSRHAPPGHLS